MSAQQRVALVTGATGGIGRAICERLAAAGHAVAVSDLDLALARGVAKALDGFGVALNVTDPAAVGQAIEAVTEWRGAPTIVINCAGFDDLSPFHETDEDLQRRILDVNLGGALRVTRQSLPAMLSAGWGRIVNISSEAGRLGGPLEVMYSSAKAGLIGATKALAREYATAGVTVNCVSPGPTDTPLLQRVTESGDDAETAMRRITRAIPMQRIGTADDVAAAVAYFCGDDASYVTGQTLSVSGGLSMM
jgi:2-hydroxycyclohexanecarboxyl-CoA dehydrogenase